MPSSSATIHCDLLSQHICGHDFHRALIQNFRRANFPKGRIPYTRLLIVTGSPTVGSVATGCNALLKIAKDLRARIKRQRHVGNTPAPGDNCWLCGQNLSLRVDGARSRECRSSKLPQQTQIIRLQRTSGLLIRFRAIAADAACGHPRPPAPLPTVSGDIHEAFQEDRRNRPERQRLSFMLTSSPPARSPPAASRLHGRGNDQDVISHFGIPKPSSGRSWRLGP